MQFKHIFLTISVFFSFLYPSFAQGQTILRHGGSVQTVEYSPVNSSLLASASDNSTIKLWNLQNDTVATLRGHNRKIHSVAFSPDGQLLVSGSDDWTFRLWDVQSQQHISTHEHINNNTRSPITEVVFSDDGQRLATAGQNVKLWEVSSRTEMATLQHDEYVLGIAFSPNGQFLAAGDQGGNVKVWDVQEQQVVAELEGDSNYVHSVAFSPDGRTLASAGYDGQIKLWTTSDWTLIGTLQNRGTSYSIEFSPDGKVLASSGYQVVTLWSIESGEQVASLSGYPEWVFGVTFSPDGKTLASAADDGTVRVQNIESHLQTLHQREMVRLIYFLPNNRSAQQDIDTKLDTLIKDVQEFYAEQMHNHGFDRKTFTFETNPTGNAVVHHVNGSFTDAYYNTETLDKVIEEIDDRFDILTDIYFIFIETGSERIDVQWCGLGGIHGNTGGRAIIPASGGCFDGETGVITAAHELGHAFGLDHDFRDDTYIMSYGETNPAQLSHCAAEWLDVHGYFNTHQNSFNETTTMTMHTPIALPSNLIRLRFEIRDTDELHQAQLIIPTHTSDPADGVKLHSCKTLNGETQNVEFTIATTTEVTLRVIDVNGNFTQETYPIIPDDIARVDVNRDGMVNVADLVLVASDFGTTAVPGAISNPDVNNDGFVNRADLLLVVEVLESDESIPMEPTLTTTISLAPTIVSSPAIGEQVTLSLNVVGGQNVAGYQATVQFDATALRYVESSNGDYLPMGAFFIQPVADGNTVTIAGTSLAGETMGEGTLATLTFEVIAVKASTVSLSDGLLTNSAGNISIPQRQPSEITAPPQSSDMNTTVSLLPANVQSPAIGEQLMLSVNITNGENVAGYQATVQFDTTALRYVESENGDYLPAGAFFIPPIAEDNTITLAASSLVGETMGDGTLATLTFEIVAVKASTLLLSDVLLTDSTGGTSVPQIEAAEITALPQLSDINNTVRLTPARVQSPAISEQLIFSVNITNGEDVAGYQATVQFDTTALRYVESSNGDYLPVGAFFIPPIAEGNTVTLAATSLAGESIGDGTLATITFEVVAVKASTVQLFDVILTDSSGGSSTPQTENAEITESSLLPEDVNEDGVVNIVDLTLAASNFGKQGTNDADVNGDGIVNIIDLMLVDAAFGNTASAPEIWSFNMDAMPTGVEVEQWLREAQQINLTDPAFQHGILVLENLLKSLTPKETALLPNYPNPFNPETWIPYQLATPSDVSVSIYSADGKLIRTLDLGHQPVGMYRHRSHAAHWDGKNNLGEPVASGVYFYTLTAGKVSATRKMLIRK